MGAIAVGFIASLFAHAKVGFLGFSGGEGNWTVGGPSVGAVAEGLVLGQSTGTPVVIFASLKLDATSQFYYLVGYLWTT